GVRQVLRVLREHQVPKLPVAERVTRLGPFKEGMTMPILTKAPNVVRLIVDEMVGMYHTPLRDAKVTIDLLFAFPKSEDDETAPVKLHGYPCVAVVKINAYKLRVLGHGDAEITIDARQWDELSEEERRALIDPELTHLELRTAEDGPGQRD